MRHWYAPASWLAWLLSPLSVIYGLGARAWHLAFDLGLRRTVRIEGVRVMSVGNIVVGGAGKTPVVIHLANEAVSRGSRVAVLSRGYGRSASDIVAFDSASLPPVDQVGDEPRLIARRCPGVTVWVGRDRVELARRAQRQGATVVILDDGFQHRRLARDVDVVVDAGFGNGWLFPSGPLREPRSGMRRATHIWGRDGRPGDIEARHVVTSILAPGGEVLPVSALKGREVVLLLGVARPDLVREVVVGLGAKVVEGFNHPDHHQFSADEQLRVRAAAQGKWLLTTQKDAERLPWGFAHVLVLDVEIAKDCKTLW